MLLTLFQDVIKHNCQDLVNKVSFFAVADENFVSAIVTRLKFEVFLADDVIIHEGELGLEMYFLKEGTVNVIRNGFATTTLEAGDYFGGTFFTSFQLFLF